MSGRCSDTCCRCAVWPSRSFRRLYCASIQPGTAGEPAMRCPLHLSAPAPSPSTRQANCFHFSRPCSRQPIVSLRSFCGRRRAFMSAPSAALRNSRGPGVRASSSVTRTSAPTGKKTDHLWRVQPTVAFSTETDRCTSGCVASCKVSRNYFPP